jgi:hypothetical protein
MTINKWLTTTTTILLVAGSFLTQNVQAKAALQQSDELEQSGGGGGGGGGTVLVKPPVKEVVLIKEPIIEEPVKELPLPEVAIKEFDVAPSATLTASEQTNFDSVVTDALSALQACRAYSGNLQNAKTNGQLVKMQVHGMVDGKCLYTAEVATQGLMTCRLSSDHIRTEDTVELALEDRSVCNIKEY